MIFAINFVKTPQLFRTLCQPYPRQLTCLLFGILLSNPCTCKTVNSNAIYIFLNKNVLFLGQSDKISRSAPVESNYSGIGLHVLWLGSRSWLAKKHIPQNNNSTLRSQFYGFDRNSYYYFKIVFVLVQKSHWLLNTLSKFLAKTAILLMAHPCTQ